MHRAAIVASQHANLASSHAVVDSPHANITCLHPIVVSPHAIVATLLGDIAPTVGRYISNMVLHN